MKNENCKYLIKQIDDFNYLDYEIEDSDFFKKHTIEYQNLAYVCVVYCKNSTFLAKILEKLAFSFDNIEIKNSNFQDEIKLLIGFYATEIFKEKNNLLDFIKMCILKNCASVQPENFIYKGDSLFFKETSAVSNEDDEIIHDIFDKIDCISTKLI